jgi:DNA (cytosine-5)-methyltransferase 1
MSDGYPAKGIEKHGLKVFGAFICGGGSTMGYKLAGYNHLGGVEIDKRLAEAYNINHNPKYLYSEDIRDFVKRNDLSDELYNLDILDGSPPCSTFSMTGKREKDWGKEKIFAEGQKKQRLDDLFFEFVKLTDKLKPKVFIAENVEGLIIENARIYVNEILNQSSAAGYNVQLFLLNSATMGVPQKRKRVFFIGVRKELSKQPLKLNFNEKPILFKEIHDSADISISNITDIDKKYWSLAKQGKPVGKFKSVKKLNYNDVCFTIAASKRHFNPLIMRGLNDVEILKCSSFPLDYNPLKINVNYLCGMSVPPVMMAQISNQIYLQWLKQ